MVAERLFGGMTQASGEISCCNCERQSEKPDNREP